AAGTPNHCLASAISRVSRSRSRAGIVRTRGVAPSSVVNPSFHASLPSSKARYKHGVYSAQRVALVMSAPFFLVWVKQGLKELNQQRPALLPPSHLIGSRWWGMAGGESSRSPCPAPARCRLDGCRKPCARRTSIQPKYRHCDGVTPRPQSGGDAWLRQRQRSAGKTRIMCPTSRTCDRSVAPPA